MRLNPSMLIVLLVGLTPVACDGASSPSAEAPEEAASLKSFDDTAAEDSADLRGGAGAGGDADEATKPNGPTANRKIIYTANVDLEVDSVAKTATDLAVLVKDLGGYVAKANTWGDDESGRSASWTLRIPATGFENAMTKLQKLGKANRVGRDSRDVTAEYVDLEAKMTNMKLQEERFRDLLRQAKTLTDTLAVEKELNRVRTDIDTWEGQLKVLKDQVSLTTIEFSATETRTSYVAVARHAFSDIVSETFRIFVYSGRTLVLAMAAVLPWAVPLGFALRAQIRRRRRKAAVSQGT